MTSTWTSVEVFKIACETGEIFRLTKLIEANFFDVNSSVVEHLTISGVSQKLSPLTYAIINGQTEVLDLLLTEGANIHEQHKISRKTPLIRAIVLRKIEMVKILLKYGADITLKDADQKSAINYVLEQELSPVCLEDQIDNIDHKLLILVLNHGCQLVGDSKSVIRHRVFCKMFKAVYENNVESLRKLLTTISDSELRKVDSSFTPLRYAIESKSFDIIKVFIEFDPRKVLFLTLHLPETWIIDIIPILEYLFINELIDINIKDKKGRTALHVAKDIDDWSNLSVFLLEHGANVNIRCENAKFPTCPVIGDDSDCPLVNYYKKLNLIDSVYVNSEALILFRHSVSEFHDLLKKDISHYKNELEILKCTRISQSTSLSSAITLFDYLFLTPDRVIRFSKNKNLVQLYRENGEDFKKKYPHYGFAINYQFRRGLYKNNLIQTAANILSKSWGSSIQIHIGHEIFQYFNINDLKKLIV